MLTPAIRERSSVEGNHRERQSRSLQAPEPGAIEKPATQNIEKQNGEFSEKC
jgi:hypothetical protein